MIVASYGMRITVTGRKGQKWTRLEASTSMIDHANNSIDPPCDEIGAHNLANPLRPVVVQYVLIFSQTAAWTAIEVADGVAGGSGFSTAYMQCVERTGMDFPLKEVELLSKILIDKFF
jgi:hypothetical protein